MKQTIKNILTILTQKEKKKFFKLVIFDVIISASDILFLIALLFVINFYTQSHHSLKFSKFPYNTFERYPLLLITAFFILFSIKNLCGFFIFSMQYKFVYGVASRLSKNKLLHYLEGSYSDYINVDSAVYTRKISQQPIEFSHYVLRGLQQIISQAVLIFFTVIAVIIFNIILFPLLFLILVPPIFLLALIMKKKLSASRILGKSTSEKAIQHLKEALAGFIESNIYGKRDFFTGRYHKFQSKLNSYLSEQQVIQNLPPRLIEVFAIFGLLLLVLLNSYLTNSQTITVITIGAFMAAAYKIIPGIVKILNSMSQIKTYSYTTADLLKDTDCKIQQRPNTGAIHSIEFAKVCFGYEKKAVVNNFCLTVNKGDFIGIAGRSGKGKTTLINLLLGFLTPSKGNILINNISTKDTDRKKYWGRISYVKQSAFLVHDSILKNITLEENEYDSKKFAQVISVTGVDELINTPGNVLNINITEDGKNISGGQRQRIILARALYKDFDLLILDEPFNELDGEAEEQLLRHLQQISGEGKTVVLITHNKTALSFCNKKINLDE
ncbi:MAG: hypothetical protein JWN83_25 [Chitinophagaceae bacterium]|nr:hypothetical protein [Chitinophagaceae bacterium]